MSDYDVIVVGAGPAGLAAARRASEGGARTLLLEKNPEIGAAKPCAEGTSKSTFKTAGISPKPHIALVELNAMVFAPNMKHVKIGEMGYAIDKTAFLQEMALKAAEAGVEIRVREPVETVGRHDNSMLVKTTCGEYRTPVVVGADGYNSTVAKSLGVTEKSESVVCVQYKMVNCNLEYPSAARVYLGGEVAPGGYAWIFPKGDRIANVGIGVRRVPAKAYLDKLVKRLEGEFKRAQIVDYRGAMVPVGGIIKQSVLDGVLLIGDAAGTVIPFTGAGIHSSIAAGFDAGEVSAKAVKEGDASRKRLMEFRKKYDEHWGDRIKKSLKAMRAIETLKDDELNMLQEIVTEQDILDLANGINISSVGTKLLKHPMLAARLARALI